MKHEDFPFTGEILWAAFLESCKSNYEDLVALFSQLALAFSEVFTDLMDFLRGDPDELYG